MESTVAPIETTVSPALITETPNNALSDLSFAELLNQARAARNAGNLISPPGNSAVELYIAASAQAGGDPVADAELSDVVLEVFGIVETVILARDAARAETAFDMARLAEPENSSLNFLDAQLNQLKLRDRVDQARVAIRDNRFEEAGTLISEARSLAGSDTTEVDLLTGELSMARGQQEVDSTLALANERLDAGNLISPANNNARYYFANVLASDPNNVAAQTGLLGVASELTLQASGAIDRNDFAAADTLLNEARALDPSNVELIAATDALADARESVTAAAQEADAARQEEADRQAEIARQVEAERLAAIQRQTETDRVTALAQQAEADRTVEAARVAAARLETERRQTEEARLAEIRGQETLKEKRPRKSKQKGCALKRQQPIW